MIDAAKEAEQQHSVRANRSIFFIATPATCHATASMARRIHFAFDGMTAKLTVGILSCRNEQACARMLRITEPVDLRVYRGIQQSGWSSSLSATNSISICRISHIGYSILSPEGGSAFNERRKHGIAIPLHSADPLDSHDRRKENESVSIDEEEVTIHNFHRFQSASKPVKQGQPT